MKSSEIKPGDKVLVGSTPTYSDRWNLRYAKLAEVVATGIKHQFHTKGSFTSGGHWSTKNNGVKVRFIEDESEEVVRPECMVSAEGENAERWEILQNEERARAQRQAELNARINAAVESLKDRGIEVHALHRAGGKIEITIDNLEKLVGLL